ncbi:hypothetical protein ASF49_21860 [Methylobacterium sp. Leaf104]|uniref:hypothetical protein n=1 Tax=Methylobacterium TaxID=407 RepID=UPI0006F26746|nr:MULTISPECIES: hypothetical protein [Methylobacterium]KQP39083.1 hypothetical protein ASF49_21860 [Methylobacterium sp. Leaf104]MCI9881688.1 hypothetical protein [Methylobacterium goesingense]
MTRVLSLLVLSLGLAGPVLAQSVGAPAGMEGATAPGGTEGRAGPRNEAEAIRSGEAIPVPPPAGGVPAEDRPARATEAPPTRP